METSSEVVGTSIQKNVTEIREEEQLSMIDFNGAEPLLSSQSVSASSLIIFSSFSSMVQATNSNANTNPLESIFSEVIWLREENARLNEKQATSNGQLAFAHQRTADLDAIIREQSKNLLEAQKIEKLNQIAVDLNRRTTCFIEGIVEQSRKQENLGDATVFKEIDQLLQYLDCKEKEDQRVSEAQIERKSQCMATFLEMYQKSKEEDAMKWQARIELHDKAIENFFKKSRKSVK